MVALIWDRTPLPTLMAVWHSSNDPYRPLRDQIHLLITAMRAQSVVVILALKYLHRLRAAPGKGFCPTDAFAEGQAQCHSTPPNLLAFFTTLLLAHKFYDEQQYTNSAWASVGGFPVRVANKLETAALDALGWKLGVGEAEYGGWLKTLEIIVSAGAGGGGVGGRVVRGVPGAGIAVRKRQAGDEVVDIPPASGVSKKQRL
ncbi:mitochondrial peripheral inner membrane protein, partial [Borealophlyctis nickersoniae]